jgi:hypothetical protein
MTPQGLVKAMNRYLSTMSEPIRTHQGVIDKYIGDSLMAYWGPPGSDGPWCRAAARTKSAEKPKLTTKRRATAPKPRTPQRPLLVIDGDSFAHRAYHALPKPFLRRGDRPAGTILGFAIFLLRFYETERPRAVLVGASSMTRW